MGDLIAVQVNYGTANAPAFVEVVRTIQARTSTQITINSMFSGTVDLTNSQYQVQTVQSLLRSTPHPQLPGDLCRNGNVLVVDRGRGTAHSGGGRVR